MKKYNITGMSCAACQSRVEKAVSQVDGITDVSVSLLTNSMQVEGDVSDVEIIKAVEAAGYGCFTKENDMAGQEELESKGFPVMKKRLISSLALLIPLMYISMGHMMWSWYLPPIIADNHILIGLIQLIITLIILVINKKFFVNGWKGIVNKSPNMDTLVALGAGAAFIYSTIVLIFITNSYMHNDMETMSKYMHDYYFESAAMIVTLITVGKMLEEYSKGKTTNALKSLMNLAPSEATILKVENGIETEIILPVEEIRIDDLFVVKPGDNVPVDGIVVDGVSAVDESALTGESVPVDKMAGSKVYSATINQSGYLKCQATKVGEDTTLSKIIQMVSDASTSKAPIAKVADKVSGVFVPIVIAIAIVTILVWLAMGYSIGFALARGISVLVISCPCALGLATPVAIMVGNGVGARNGILFKNAVALENTGKSQIVALDKTGTITEGKPYVTDVVAKHDKLMEYAYSLEMKSEHPLAKAIIEYGKENKISKKDVSEFKAEIGNGLKGIIENEIVYGGSLEYISTLIELKPEEEKSARDYAKQGKTPLLFAKGKEYLGMIAVADVIKKESRQAIKELKEMGLKVLMLTGDNANTANAIGKEAGVDKVIANVLPQGKEGAIKELSKKGKTIMVGDGINDAPALTRADCSIAIGAGTDIAIDAADIVLVKSNLMDVPSAIRLSKGVLKNIHENLFWAFFYNVIGIPIAAGMWYPLFGLKLNPMFGAAAMSLSSFCVVMNALRLNWLDIRTTKKDKKIKNDICIEIKEEVNMEKKMTINGMMCGHCEASVKKALEAIEGVDVANVSHEKNMAVITLSKDVSNDVLKKAVEEKDYEVIDIK